MLSGSLALNAAVRLSGGGAGAATPSAQEMVEAVRNWPTGWLAGWPTHTAAILSAYLISPASLVVVY